MSQARVLIVDDEPDIRELLELTLSRMDLACHPAADLGAAMGLLRDHRFDLCLTDMLLPDGSGIDLVRHIQERCPDLPVAVITAHGNMGAAVEALKAGAFDFVSKPVELRILRELVDTALRTRGQPAMPEGNLQLIGESPPMAAIRQTIAKLARSQAPVYISGESGTGKELVARLIHQLGGRADAPFIPVNCGAIPAELMESELFGHAKGSFTGATADKPGLFQAAHGGTLFLDEVAELPLHMQVKLLRAIQEKSVRPVGAQRESHVDVRILSATHRDLGQLVRDGRFREDLYYRINVIELQVPSLRERREDLPLLIEALLGRITERLGIAVPALAPAAEAALAAYDFPGNVRELENVLERAVTLSEGTIDVADLGLPEGREAEPRQGEDAVPKSGLEPFLQTVEKNTIMQALEKAGYNKTAAARLLGISFRALRYRLKKLGLD